MGPAWVAAGPTVWLWGEEKAPGSLACTTWLCNFWRRGCWGADALGVPYTAVYLGEVYQVHVHSCADTLAAPFA